MGITITNSGQGSVVRFRNLGRGGVMTSTKNPPFLLLNYYPGASVAYSLRKLNYTYTGSAIRVRRSSDNAEQNIGFVNNELDTVSLLAFCGAGNGFVTTWYDQSGNGNNLTQITNANQPIIVSLGTLILRNTKPYFRASNTQFFLINTTISTSAINNYSFWMPYEKDTSGNQAVLLYDNGSYHWLDYTLTQYVNQFYSVTIPSVYAINTLYLNNTISIASGTATIYRNNVSIGSTSIVSNLTSTRYIPSNSFRTGNMIMSEFVFYPSNQTANRIGISSNINSYYSIY